jgi:hypothetical protein
VDQQDTDLARREGARAWRGTGVLHHPRHRCKRAGAGGP